MNVSGALDSEPNASYTLEFFASAACNASGYGEGQVYLGSIPVATDDSCNAPFSSSFAADLPVGWVVTATATDSFGDTSEFSQCVTPSASFYTVTPCRVIDTRNANGPLGGPALSGGSGRTFAIANQCGIPATATSVSANVTITGPTAQGHLTFNLVGLPPPLVSTINYRAGQTRANNAILVLGTAGDFVVSCAQASGTVDFILDVNGYFQ